MGKAHQNMTWIEALTLKTTL